MNRGVVYISKGGGHIIVERGVTAYHFQSFSPCFLILELVALVCF